LSRAAPPRALRGLKQARKWVDFEGMRGKLLIVGVLLLGLGAGVGGSWAAFRATAVNSGNAVAAGTLSLTDNDGGASSMFSLTGLKGYDTATRCIKVTNSGTLAARVRMYGTTTGTGLDPYLSVVVTRGSYSSDPGFSSCTNFVPDATNYVSGRGNGVIYAGTLQDFPDDYASGIDDPTSSATEDWVPGETHVYKVEITVADDDSAASKNATQAFTWEARNISGYEGTILSTSGLQSYWRLGESSGTTATDLAGTTDGTYTNAPTLGQPGALTSDSDTAVSFDGTNDFVGFGDNYGFAGSAAFSAEAWVKQTAAHASVSVRFFDKVNYGTNRDGWLMVNQGGDNPTFIRYSGTGTNGTSVSAPTGTITATNGWHHIVGTYDGTNLRLYIDGVLRGGPTAAAYAMNAHTSPLALGGQAGSGANSFPGLIDDAAIYNVALSAQQVEDHYRSGITGG
jgi:hypothetical protein